MTGPMTGFFKRRKAAYLAFVEKQAGQPGRLVQEGENSSMVSVGCDAPGIFEPDPRV